VSMFMEAIVVCSAKVHVFIDVKLYDSYGRGYIVCASLYGRYTRYVLHRASYKISTSNSKNIGR
jgi:hypothetical protein